MKSTRIEEREEHNNRTLYLDVEPHYNTPSVGGGEEDAVLFEMGQVSNGEREIDSAVTCSVDKARAFAESILQACNEIEEEISNEELIAKFKDACLNLPGSGAKGRTHYYRAEEEILQRLGGRK